MKAAAKDGGVISKVGKMAMSYELLLKERDELQREAATANAELFAVLKQSEYRSAEELGLVRAQAPHQEHSPPCLSLPTLAQPAIHHVCRAPFTSRCARCQTNAFRHPPVFMNWDACPQSARRRCCCCTVALVGMLCTLAAARQKPALPALPTSAVF